MSKEELADMRLTDEKNGEKSEKKLTVLESHGYALGKTIGAGSYATVKVIHPSYLPFLFPPNVTFPLNSKRLPRAQIAKSDRHDCQVAVKIVSKFQAPGEYLTKFLPREIEVVKGLKHPNLIHFLQAIETTHRLVYPSKLILSTCKQRRDISVRSDRDENSDHEIQPP